MIIRNFKFNDRVDNLKLYLNDLDILKCEEDGEEYWNNRKIALKHKTKNDEDEIGDLNRRRINCLKIKEKI